MLNNLAALLPVWILGAPLLLGLYELAMLSKELAHPETPATVRLPTEPTPPKV